ncbi:MAG TPA: ABC transporter permease, partial [Gemmatimonadaceae bacterium]|nr:ABC transporter permease [Gemmatimonadaceae bacterium]
MSAGKDPREIRDGVRRVVDLGVHRTESAARDADAEMESMMAEHAAHLEARGIDPAAARAQALHTLSASGHDASGDVRRSARDRERRLRLLDLLGELRADARLALRGLRRAPAFATAAVLTLALAIGANTAIFSAVSAVVLRPLPFADQDRLVAFWETNPDFHWTRAQAAPANYLDWKDQVAAFDDIAAYFDFDLNATLTGFGEPRMLASRSVTGNLFQVLGVRPLLGRTFDTAATWNASNAPGPAVLSYALWRDVLGRDSSVVGRTIQLNGRAVTVIGVMPESFVIPGMKPDLYRPIGWDPNDRAKVSFRRAHSLRLVGRLKPGATLAEANAQLQAVTTRLQSQHPETNTHMGAGLEPLHQFLVGDASRLLYAMLGGVAVLLLIACANVANLLLVRVAGRQREMALRLALGAGRGRLARTAFTESVVLAVAGGVAGLAIGWAGTRALMSMQPPGTLPVAEFAVDRTVLAYVTAVTLVASLVFGVAPALWATRRAPADALKDDGRGASTSRRARRLGETLLVAQVA